jgi:hypothetical protein
MSVRIPVCGVEVDASEEVVSLLCKARVLHGLGYLALPMTVVVKLLRQDVPEVRAITDPVGGAEVAIRNVVTAAEANMRTGAKAWRGEPAFHVFPAELALLSPAGSA